jgi:hypothetical protein
VRDGGDTNPFATAMHKMKVVMCLIAHILSLWLAKYGYKDALPVLRQVCYVYGMVVLLASTYVFSRQHSPSSIEISRGQSSSFVPLVSSFVTGDGKDFSSHVTDVKRGQARITHHRISHKQKERSESEQRFELDSRS